MIKIKISRRLVKVSCVLLAVWLSLCVLSLDIGAERTEALSAAQTDSALYGADSFTPEMKRLYTDMVAMIDEKIVKAGDLNGKIVELEGVAVTGDKGLRRVDGLVLKTKDYGVTYSELVAVYSNMKHLHPEFYFLASTFLKATDESAIYPLVVESLSKKSARQEIDSLIESECLVYDGAIEDCKSSYEKALAIHDLMVDRLDYAYDENGAPQSAYWAHSIVGAVKQMEGTCETFAKWYTYLLTRAGVANYPVVGTSRGQGHAWNLVQMDDGNWYNIDVTWDDGSEHEEFGRNYTYFATAKSVFDQTHTANDNLGSGFKYLYNLPKAEESYAYCPYYVNGQMPDMSDAQSAWQDYLSIWKRALERGELTVVLYVKDAQQLQMLKEVAGDINKTASALRSMGFEDELKGKLTFYKSSLGDNLYKVRIEKEMPKPVDPDKNGTTDEADVIYIMQFILGYKGTSGDNCDINKDGRIDLRDAVVLLQSVRDQ